MVGRAISIHALLAESDVDSLTDDVSTGGFLSTLSLRRATLGSVAVGLLMSFLSTLSLRRATIRKRQIISIIQFLSTLSLRRATIPFIRSSAVCIFLSTLSLRRATHREKYHCHFLSISIHALLAESDLQCCFLSLPLLYFYPRSPCGERR